MTLTIVIFALYLAVTAWVVMPLFFKSHKPLGTGVEDDSPVRRWDDEKNRLVAQLRENDIALAEQRIDRKLHQQTASKLRTDAERALSQLRQARSTFSPQKTTMRGARPFWMFAPICLVLVSAAFGANIIASHADLDMTRSPHEDGTIPLPADMTARIIDNGHDDGSSLGSDGAPDIGAMVAGLEARIAEGEYSLDEAHMLLRSYRTLSRQAEAEAFLEKAVDKYPNDAVIVLNYVDTQLGQQSTDDLNSAATALANLLARQPDLPRAQWYQSLLLVRQGRMIDAKAILTRLAPRMADNPEASGAISQLLNHIAQAQTSSSQTGSVTSE